MMEFVSSYPRELIATGFMTLTLSILRYIVIKLIKRYAIRSETIEHRKNLVIKYISIFITSLFIIGLMIIWGVKTDDLFVTISSVLTVIGVALFAQWSILSNITSGFIILFSFPFKIGDTIKVHDKDFPIEGEIISIHTFYTLVQTIEGELVTYPNSLFLQKGISIDKKTTRTSFDEHV